MESFWMLGVLVIALVLGIVLMAAVIWTTENFERGRGFLALAAFFSPFLFIGYLLIVGYLRDEYHHARGEASNFDGQCTLPLGDGYILSFFDESPSASTIVKGDFGKTDGAALSNVQKEAVRDHTVIGQTGTSAFSDSSVDFFFRLSTSTGEISKFKDEHELREHAPHFGPLTPPDEAFNVAEDQQRNRFFWPIAAGIPLVLLAGGLHSLGKANRKGSNVNRFEVSS